MLKRFACPKCGSWNLGERHRSPDPTAEHPVTHNCPACGSVSYMRQQSKAWINREIPFSEMDVPDFGSSNHLLGLQMKAAVGNRKARGRPTGTRKKAEHWGVRGNKALPTEGGDDRPPIHQRTT